jgi:3-oxoacyl-[acyl-carrier protein] reductase
VPCNLGDKESVDTALVPAAVEKLGGKIDILVNNAGVTRDNLAMRMKDEEWEDVIRINLEAAFRLMRAAAKPMMKARFGRIITITSVVGATGNPGQVNYAASKAGLVGMSKALGQNSPAAVTVNCMAPGFIRTAMTDVLPDAQKEALNARIPDGPHGRGRRYRRGSCLSRLERCRLCHRPDAACEWRHGDALTRFVRHKGTQPLPAALLGIRGGFRYSNPKHEGA